MRWDKYKLGNFPCNGTWAGLRGLEQISKFIIVELEGTLPIQLCFLIFYKKNKNTNEFLKADPNLKPQPPGLTY